MNIEDEKQNIKICSSVIFVMRQYILSKGAFREAGGILIGKENISNNNLIIKYCTIPYEKDRRSHYKFIRQDEQHIEFFEKVYDEHKGIYRYVGEWHTHDENMPRYSKMDLDNWRRIYKEVVGDSGTLPHYHIVVGKKAFRIWRVTNDLAVPQLVKTVAWKEMK